MSRRRCRSAPVALLGLGGSRPSAGSHEEPWAQHLGSPWHEPACLRSCLPELQPAQLALDPDERQGVPAGRRWHLLGAAEPKLLALRPRGGPRSVPGGLPREDADALHFLGGSFRFLVSSFATFFFASEFSSLLSSVRDEMDRVHRPGVTCSLSGQGLLSLSPESVRTQAASINSTFTGFLVSLKTQAPKPLQSVIYALSSAQLSPTVKF